MMVHRVQITYTCESLGPLTEFRCSCGWKQVCMTEPAPGAWRVKNHFEANTGLTEGNRRPRKNQYYFRL